MFPTVFKTYEKRYIRFRSNEVLYGPANDSRTADDPQIVPQMIPGPEMISRLYHKWSRTGNGRFAIKFENVRTQESGQWILNLCNRFFMTVKLRKSWTFGFDSKRLIWYWTIKFRTREKTSKPQPTGQVRYINILTSFRGFRVKIAIFLSFLCLSIPKRDLDTKKTTPNVEVYPESLGPMLKYWYIERGLLPLVFAV